MQTSDQREAFPLPLSDTSQSLFTICLFVCYVIMCVYMYYVIVQVYYVIVYVYYMIMCILCDHMIVCVSVFVCLSIYVCDICMVYV